MANCQIGKGFRLVIPSEQRKKYGLKEGDIVILEDNGKGFTVSPAEVVRKKA